MSSQKRLSEEDREQNASKKRSTEPKAAKGAPNVEDRGKEEEIINLSTPRRKPAISKADHASHPLLSRLSVFLPKLALANQELEEERAKGTLEERQLEQVQPGAAYIEMDLGLGVLEEKADSCSPSPDAAVKSARPNPR